MNKNSPAIKNDKNNTSSHNSYVTNHRGQGLVEYLIIISLVAMAAFSIMKILGDTVHTRFQSISTALKTTGKHKKTLKQTKKDMEALSESSSDNKDAD